jgi:NADH-quinone oxidoreductase subunit M
VATAGEPAQLPGSIFFGLALILEGLAIYCFLSVDVLLFYLFFEATLLPMYFLISGWGGPRRRAAALKFIIYSLVGGLIMLVAVIGLGVHSGVSGQTTFLLADLARGNFDGAIGRYLFVGFFIAFAIKAPMVPVHTWLPDVAEQATPGSSALLVGILDKIGTFGMLRLCLGLFPEAAHWATPVVLTLAVVSILWGAMMAATSKDLMRLVSYTSVSHFGFMVLGIFAVTTPSITGSIFYMFNHGFATAALFLVLGFLVHRRGSARIEDFGGVQKTAPVLAGLFLVSGLATLGLPGTSSFASEFLVLAGSWQRHPVYVAVATLGMVLAAVYVLRAYKRTMTGPVTEGTAEHVTADLGGREKAVLAPLIIVLLVFGFFPKPMLNVIEPAARATMSQVGMTDPQPVVKEGVK